MIFLSSQHYFLATLALFSLIATTLTGFVLLTKIGKKFFKAILILHTVLGLITLISLIFTYFLAPKL